MNGASSPADGPTIPGPYVPPQQSETSPLRQSLLDKQRSCFDFLWNWEINTSESGSLKTVVVILFGATGAVTLALLTQVYYGEYQLEPHGSVTSDSYDCSTIGTNILQQGGNAVDAAIACTMCLGVVNFHVTGLGGGGYMMIYNHRKHEMVDNIDFRETVPDSYGSRTLETYINGLMVGVPGFLKGLWDAHERHGKLPWSDLVMPSVLLARNGFLISESVFASRQHLDPPSAANNNLWGLMNSIQVEQNMTLPKLAATLELIATKGPDVFYNGSLADEIVYSVKIGNGSMTSEDIAHYKTSQSELLQTRFAGFDVLVPGSSSAGALLLNSLDSIMILDLNVREDDPAETVLKMSDVLHDTYSSFVKKSGAVSNIPEPAASHVSVIDNTETYVSVVSGLSTWLGSQILTDAGFILNKAIANGGIDHERRPVSLATPIIAVENGEVCGRRLILGSGDATIAAQMLTQLLILHKNTSASIESPRFHINNAPRHIKLEDQAATFSNETIRSLEVDRLIIEILPAPYTSVNVVEKFMDNVTSFSDSRGGGASVSFR